MIEESALYSTFLLALAVWREARGEITEAKRGVAWSVMNRVSHPGWWGTGVVSVILKEYQYSSFNRQDPNSTKWPQENDTSWQASLAEAIAALDGTSNDPTFGAHSYYSDGIPAPAWAETYTFKVKLGNLNFFG